MNPVAPVTRTDGAVVIALEELEATWVRLHRTIRGPAPKAQPQVPMTQTEPVVRLAILGFGTIARQVHLPLLAGQPGVAVAAIADPDPGARALAQSGTAGARVFADWREALATPGLDAVIVASPTAVHAEATLAALARRLHVYVEKPIATTLADADEVLAAWRESKSPAWSVSIIAVTRCCFGSGPRSRPVPSERPGPSGVGSPPTSRSPGGAPAGARAAASC